MQHNNGNNQLHVGYVNISIELSASTIIVQNQMLHVNEPERGLHNDKSYIFK